jgi:outer membrane biosynthesis protein TonB
VLAWILSLFRRQPKREASPIREQEAYARSYGERSGDVVGVARVEPTEPEPEPEPEPKSEPTAEAEPKAETKVEAEAVTEPEPGPKPIPRRTGDLTGELLRRAFETRLDARGKTAT